MDKKRILFVCQRYGLDVNGGAETECREYAERLTPFFRVEALTSCARDYVTWANYYPPGEETINGVLVRRFPALRMRGGKRFGRSAGGGKSESADDPGRRWLEDQGPYVPELIDYLVQHGSEYACVLFMTYLYYPTAIGITACSCPKKVMIPTAHDEDPIYHEVFDRSFAAADKFVYNSEAEKRFVKCRFPFAASRPSITIGSGVEPVEQSGLPDARERFGLNGPYLLYSGRIDTHKGCDVLLRYFAAYKERHPGDLSLVLTGREVIEVPQRSDIRSLGFVSEEDKFAVMRDARCFVLPSGFESLSIVTLESMMMGRPVLVNGKCEVLVDHCRLSNAGLYYRNYYEFEACVEYLLADSPVYEAMRENGRRYVAQYYNWDGLIEKLRRLIEE